MKTIIEFFDNENLLNILAVCAFDPAPENVVFIGEFSSDKEKDSFRSWLEGFLEERKISSEIHLYDTDFSDFAKTIRLLQKIRDKFPECVLEVTGGKPLALLAAGMFAQSNDIPIFHYDSEKRCFSNINDGQADDRVALPHLSARDFFELSHTGVLGYGHFSPPQLNDDALDDARQLWMLFLAFRSCWHKLVSFFQGLEYSGKQALHAVSSRAVKGLDQKKRDVFLRELKKCGMIKNLEHSGPGVRFIIKNPVVKAMLQDAGAALELFTYSCIKKHPDLFDDCEINIRIDWDGNGPSKTSNELDVVAVSKLTPLFISCKSGKLETSQLNEIFAVTSKLGGLFAKPVLMTAGLSSGQENRWMLSRAKDMGIAQIGLDDICPVFAKRQYRGLCDCRSCRSHVCEKNLAHLLADVCTKED